MKSSDTARPGSALLVILAGVSAALHVSKLAPALPALQQAMAISLLQSGFLLSLVQLAGMSLGLAIGLTADRLGLRRSMMAGLLLLCGASIAGAQAHSVLPLLMLRAVEGLGFLLVVTPAPSLIRELVPPARLSMVLGLWGGYMPLGTAIALLCGPLLIALTGWPFWWWLLGLLSGLMAVVLWFQVPSDASRHAHSSTGVQPTVALASWQQRLRQTLSVPGPWLIGLCFAMYASQWLAVVGFLPSIYSQAGMGAGRMGVLTALVAAVNIIGNVAAGRLLQRGTPAPRLLTVGFVSMVVGGLLTFSDWGGGLAPSGRYAAVLLFSCVGGLVPSTLFSLAVRFAPGPSTVSTTVGWMQQLSAVGQFCGPPIVAWGAQWLGGWRWTGLIIGACSLVGLGLVWAISRALARLPRRSPSRSLS